MPVVMLAPVWLCRAKGRKKREGEADDDVWLTMTLHLRRVG